MNPLDLNNLPGDYFIREHSKQPLDNSNSAASGIYGKKKNSSKDERTKVYECRFCSLKFRKSQALGGHMNRHRQERETETLNQARQLVFGTDHNIAAPTHQQLGGQLPVHGGFKYSAGFNMSDAVYPSRLFSGEFTTVLPPPPSSMLLPPQPHHHVFASMPSGLSNVSLTQYSNSPLINDYFVDRYVSTNRQLGLKNLSRAKVHAYES